MQLHGASDMAPEFIKARDGVGVRVRVTSKAALWIRKSYRQASRSYCFAELLWWRRSTPHVSVSVQILLAAGQGKILAERQIGSLVSL